MDAKDDTLYARWLSGDLTPAEEAQLKASGESEELDAIIQATDQFALPEYDAAAGFKQFKEESPLKKETTVRQLQSRKTWIISSVAASLLLLITATYFLLNTNSVLEADNQSILAHQFKDQTSVILNDGSSIEFDEGSWQEQRTVELTGEAFFEVEKGRPFIVHTHNGTVKVLGTQFNVRTWGSRLYVECYEGSVQVQSNQQKTILTQSEAVEVTLGKMSQKQTITHQEPFWKKGISRFYNESIKEVFAELERQYDITITTNTITANREFSGSFSHDDLEIALTSVCKPMGFQFDILDGGKLVTIDKN